jgi:hypothetical protein
LTEAAFRSFFGLEHPADAHLDWARSRQFDAHGVVASGLFELPLNELGAPQWLQSVAKNFDPAPVVFVEGARLVNALATADLYRKGAYPITARPHGLARNPFLSTRPL